MKQDDASRVDELTLKLIDREITDAEASELLHLTHSAANCDHFVRLIRLDCYLKTHAMRSVADGVLEQLHQERRQRVSDSVMESVTLLPESARSNMQSDARKSHRKGIRVGSLVAAASLMLVIFWSGLFESNEASVVQLLPGDSNVQVFSADAVVRPILHRQPVMLNAGDTIITTQAIDPVVVKYADGTTIDLHGDSRVKFQQHTDGPKQLYVLSGFVQANVEQQPLGQPLRIVTSTAMIEVLGTTLCVEVRDQRTQLEVVTGRVAMTRNVDGKRVEVEAGRLATATHRIDGQLIPRPFPPLPDDWSQDFSNGLPSGWSAGELIVMDTGNAVKAMGDGHGQESNIAVTTQNAWHEGEHGLFNIHADSVLHIRFRQTQDAPLRVMLVTREYPPEKLGRGERARGTNLYYEDPSWNGGLAPNRWHTVSIPLSQPTYHGKRQNFSYNTLNVSGLAAFILQISSLEQDIGLVVERIWVTRQHNIELP